MHYTTFEGEVFNQVPDKGFDFNQVLTGKDAAFLTFKQGSGSMIACNGMLCRKELYDELLKDVTSSSYVYQDEVDFFLYYSEPIVLRSVTQNIHILKMTIV